MNQSARTLAYHLHAMQIVTRLVEARQRHDLAGAALSVDRVAWDMATLSTTGKRTERHPFPDRLNREYDPNAEAEQVERGCPLDVRRGM